MLRDNSIKPFVIDIANNKFESDDFLKTDILIVNIPFKDVLAFSELVKKVAQSTVSHVIFISSTSVYGDKEGLVSEECDDDLATHPLLDIEALFTSNKHFTTTVVRFAGLIGPQRNPAKFFKNNKVVNSPESQVNMIHREDCINIINLIIEKEKWNGTYNACADTHPTKTDFYTYVATISGLPIPIFSNNTNSGNKIVNNHKIKKELGYCFLYPNLLELNVLDIT
jgi:nucleoside-diphosphate-sugar epimerase